MKYVEGQVLDIGCGAGRHSLYLQEKGFDVLGIDISPLAIQVCKLRGLKKGRVMTIYDVDFPPNSFDTILMMGNNFGLLGNYIQAKELLNKFYQFTTSNSVIIANSYDPYKTDNPSHLAYHKLNRKRGRLSGQLRLRIRFGKFVTPWFEYLLVSKNEMKDILHGTGWEIQDVIDSDNSSYLAIIRKLT